MLTFKKFLISVAAVITALVVSGCSSYEEKNDDYQFTISPVSGNYDSGTEISIQCSDSAYEIHYTTDGTEPTVESPVYTIPFTLNKDMTVKAIIVKNGKVSEQCISSAYTLIKYEILFNADHGNTPWTEKVSKGYVINVSSLAQLTDAENKYAFSGWNIEDGYEVTSDITINPLWSEGFNVYLESYDASEKFIVIKKVSELYGIGLSDAKILVESSPKLIKTTLTREEADKRCLEINDAGGTAKLVSCLDRSIYSPESTTKEGTYTETKYYDIYLESYDRAKKIAVIKAVKETFGLGLGEAKTLVEAAPRLIGVSYDEEKADSCVEKIVSAGARAYKVENN